MLESLNIMAQDDIFLRRESSLSRKPMLCSSIVIFGWAGSLYKEIIMNFLKLIVRSIDTDSKCLYMKTERSLFRLASKSSLIRIPTLHLSIKYAFYKLKGDNLQSWGVFTDLVNFLEANQMRLMIKIVDEWGKLYFLS